MISISEKIGRGYDSGYKRFSLSTNKDKLAYTCASPVPNLMQTSRQMPQMSMATHRQVLLLTITRDSGMTEGPTRLSSQRFPPNRDVRGHVLYWPRFQDVSFALYS
jgi:hypothetical protein